MEDLNKQQLVLLTLLVSFVTSIATGIITFTLLQEAPVAVTQTINRVVERTIEKVVPEEGGGTVTEVTTVVSEEDLVLESINKNTKSIVRVKTTGFDGSSIVVGLGVVVSSNGTIVMDRKNYTAGVNYTITYHDGKSYNLSKVYDDLENGIVFIRPGKPANETYTFSPAIFGAPSKIKLGQTVIAVGGKERNAVSIGRVADLETGSGSTLVKIHTDIRTNRSLGGSPLLNLSGELVGIETGVLESASSLFYLPINIVEASFAEAQTQLNK